MYLLLSETINYQEIFHVTYHKRIKSIVFDNFKCANKLINITLSEEYETFLYSVEFYLLNRHPVFFMTSTQFAWPIFINFFKSVIASRNVLMILCNFLQQRIRETSGQQVTQRQSCFSVPNQFFDPLLVFVAFSFIAFFIFADEQSAVKEKTGYLYWWSTIHRNDKIWGRIKLSMFNYFQRWTREKNHAQSVWY